MNMNELAMEYRRSAALLKERIDLLQSTVNSDKNICPMEKLRLRGRINVLTTMYRQAIDAAFTMERYYDRRYRRNARYTL